MVEFIKTLEDFNRITNGDKPVVIDFTASWCGPCHMIAPVFEGLSKQDDLANAVEFYKVDVDEASDISQACGIRAMPTFKVFKGGAEIDSIRGANPAGLETLVRTAANGSDAASSSSAPDTSDAAAE